MNQVMHHHETLIGTLSGTILSISFMPSGIDMVHTVILAVLGAGTGFLTTKTLKYIITRHGRK